MISALLLFAAALAGYLGFACLALAMPRHWAEASGEKTAPPHQHWLRTCGFTLLGMAFAICVCRDGLSFGTVLATVLISASMITVALTLAWRPRLLSFLITIPAQALARTRKNET